MLRAGKRDRSFEEALLEKGAENLGSPGGYQDLRDCQLDLRGELDEALKIIARQGRDLAAVWEALADEQRQRIKAVDDLRALLDGVLSRERHVSGVPEAQRTASPTSVLGQVIDLTSDVEEAEPEDEYPEPWEEAYPAPDRDLAPESQYEEF
ncbi:MAG: hypothetical protein [Cressdnaviricota sp.]|nr:MAG: hypothetical protein [Cressdnaviricota sp.]